MITQIRSQKTKIIEAKRKQSIHRHQTLSQSRNAASGFRSMVSCPRIAIPYGPLRPNVTSPVNMEACNVSQRHQRRTEPWPQMIYTKNYVKIGLALSLIHISEPTRPY